MDKQTGRQIIGYLYDAPKPTKKNQWAHLVIGIPLLLILFIIFVLEK